MGLGDAFVFFLRAEGSRERGEVIHHRGTENTENTTHHHQVNPKGIPVGAYGLSQYARFFSELRER